MKGFVIDTNKYAGNFERELCAYITGVVGDCGVGDHCIEYPAIKGVKQVPDEHHCFRPCAIYPNPDYLNNGMGYHFKAGEEATALKEWKESHIEHEEKWIKVEEGHRGKNLQTWTDEAIDASVKRRKEKIKEVEATTKLRTWPAYNSVIIYFDDEYLTDEVIELMKERAHEYEKDFTIESFRVVELQPNAYVSGV